jgi:hypothetical protein
MHAWTALFPFVEVTTSSRRAYIICGYPFKPCSKSWSYWNFCTCISMEHLSYKFKSPVAEHDPNTMKSFHTGFGSLCMVFVRPKDRISKSYFRVSLASSQQNIRLTVAPDVPVVRTFSRCEVLFRLVKDIRIFSDRTKFSRRRAFIPKQPKHHRQ